MTVDVAIAGGGPAGSVLALLLARSGRSVLLFEKSAFPRDKLCGEFLSPEAVGYLERLDLARGLGHLRPAPIVSVRFAAGNISTHFHPLERPGWGLSRRRFDAFLLEAAGASGAVVSTSSRVRGARPAGDSEGFDLEIDSTPGGRFSIRVRALVNATGRHHPPWLRQQPRPGSRRPSPAGEDDPDAGSDRSAAPDGGKFVAFKRHLRPRDARDPGDFVRSVELFPFPDGYVGLNPVEDGRFNLCFLVRAFRLRLEGGRPERVLDFARSGNPHLEKRLRSLVPCQDRFLSASGLVYRENRGRVGAPPLPILSIGDSAGRIPPLCGDGISMAMRSALLAAEALSDPGKERVPWETTVACYERTWRSEFGSRIRLGTFLHQALLGKHSGALLIRFARAFPGIIDWAYRRTREWPPLPAESLV